MSFFLTDGPIMPYAWGSQAGISLLLGRAPQVTPEAELWMGAHPKGPSRLIDAGPEVIDLRALIASSPARYLGAAAAATFGELPFLFKVLAIDRPLSLQAHPNMRQARAGFEREDALGIGRASARRNYRDQNHKPELLLALSSVDLVCGFREVPDIARVMRAFGLDDQQSALCPALAFLASDQTSMGIERFFRSLFALTPSQLERVVARLLEHAAQIAGPAEPVPLEPTPLEPTPLEPTPPEYEFRAAARWVVRLAQAYGHEPGLIVFLLLRLVTLKAGQAVYLAPRRLHAYLSGVGLELMANSDNVLRGGLTTKHVDVEELSGVLDFQPSQPELIVADSSAPWVGVTEARWNTPAEEFSLRRFVLTDGRVAVPAPGMLLVLGGDLEVSDGRDARPIKAGAQVFCAADETTFVSGSGEFYCATLPFV